MELIKPTSPCPLSTYHRYYIPKCGYFSCKILLRGTAFVWRTHETRFLLHLPFPALVRAVLISTRHRYGTGHGLESTGSKAWREIPTEGTGKTTSVACCLELREHPICVIALYLHILSHLL